MPKRDLVRRIDQRAATGTAGSGGSGAASGNADTVDGIHASRTPTANMLVPLDASALLPAAVLPPISVDALSDVAISGTPADNELLAWDTAAAGWINQTAAEAGVAESSHAHAGADITSGTISTDRYSAYADLTAETKIGTGSTQVAAGDHAHFSDAEGDPSALGTSADGVSAYAARRDHVHPDTLDSDLDFATYKAVAMACDNGTTFPATPATGQWYYRTDCDCLFMYEAAWKPIISFGAMTLYVDGTDGSDAAGQGFAVDAGATETIQYAINLIPGVVGGNVIVNIAAGSYTETITIDARVFTGAYTIRIEGAKTQQASGTVSENAKNFLTAGTGTVSTVGSSTTVTFGGGGATTALWPGALITANNLTRTVATVDSSTQVTVNSAVDWSAGCSWKYTQMLIGDSSAAWADDAHNDQLLLLNNAELAGHWIRDTIASSKRLESHSPWGNTITNASTTYNVYALDTTIVGAITVRCNNVTLAFIICDGNDAVVCLTTYAVNLNFICLTIKRGANQSLAALGGSSLSIYSCYFYDPKYHTMYVQEWSYIQFQRCLINTNSYGGFSTQVGHIYPYWCRVDSSSSTHPAARASSHGLINPGNCIFNRISGYTTGADADYHGQLRQISTGALIMGYTTLYSADAATYAIAN